MHNPNPMSPNKVVNMLAEITAKGGSLLLGVGPSPMGTIDPVIAGVLSEVGDWLDVNGRAIYSTRCADTFRDGSTWFTADKDGTTLYAIYALPDGEQLPDEISWKGNIPSGKLTLLHTGRQVGYKVSTDGTVSVKLPKGLPAMPVAFSFKTKKS